MTKFTPYTQIIFCYAKDSRTYPWDYPYLKETLVKLPFKLKVDWSLKIFNCRFYLVIKPHFFRTFKIEK